MITYYQLYREVNRFAEVLKNLGIRKGDRVTLYLPMIPELPIAMLATARLGAIHNVVFSGFSGEALANRINDSGSKVLITSDGAFRRGKVLPLKTRVDKALQDAPMVEAVIVVKRANCDVNMIEGRDYWFHELMEGIPSFSYTHQVPPVSQKEQCSVTKTCFPILNLPES